MIVHFVINAAAQTFLLNLFKGIICNVLNSCTSYLVMAFRPLRCQLFVYSDLRLIKHSDITVID